MNEENYVAQAIDRNTEFFKTNSCGDYDFAIRTAKYYRSIGYNAKVFSESEYDNELNKNTEMRNNEIKKQRESKN